jgi:uncharacterized membrane protein YsdA (DUF1294 family)
MISGAVSLILAIITAVLIWFFGYPINEWQSWLIAISAISFLVFGYDKMMARGERRRIPETVLLVLTLIGGTAGSAIGMILFHHKTRKTSFLTRVLTIVVLQVIGLALFYFLR